MRVTFENNFHLKVIENFAFKNCSSLSEITIPSSDIIIEISYFKVSIKLEKIMFE